MHIGVTNSTTIARKSISLAPGSLSEAVCASEFFQCQILSTALNGNIATRHTRAPYQTSSSSPDMPGSPSKTQNSHVSPTRHPTSSLVSGTGLVEVNRAATATNREICHVISIESTAACCKVQPLHAVAVWEASRLGPGEIDEQPL